MSKRGKKRQNKDDDDEMWEEKDKQVQKKLQKLKKVTQSKEQSDEEDQQKKFIFNFSNQKQFLKKEKEIQQKEKEREKILRSIRQEEQKMKKQEKPQLSDAALAEKSQRKQKEKQKKQNKDKLKQQRKEAEKMQQTIEKQKKQQQQKLHQLAQAEYKKRRESQSRDGWKIVIGLLLFILVAGFLQYKSEINQRYDSFRVRDSEDLYSILEADSGLSDAELKQKYRKLALKYHPDKNKDCVDCKERFARILKAWEILGNPEKREAYDSNNGIITKIKSKSITLTRQNYYEEVESSNDLWIIQAYDSTSQYCHHFSQFWEQIVDSFRGLVKFGRIDIWNQNDMKDYIPYSFTIFPSIYSIRKDKSSDIYGLDPRRPIETMKQFIEKELSKQYPEVKIDLQTLNQKLSTIQKPLVTTNKLMNHQLKSILSKYSDYVDGYMVQDKQFKLQPNEIRVYYNSTDYNKYILKTLPNHLQFSLELSKYFVQKMSLCQMINYYEDYPCAIVANKTSQTFVKTKYPQILVSDDILTQKVNQIKLKLGLFESFQYTLYSNGKVEFGNLQDLDVINVQQQGQIIQLTCIPSIRIPYWQLTKIGGILLLMLYTSNRKILGVLGLVAAYMVYNIFF